MHKRFSVTILLLLAIGLAVRLLLLGSKSLWADEAYAAALTGLPLLDGAALFSRGTPHPIGGFFFIWASAALFGQSAAGLRLLTALLTSSAVIPVYGFVRRRIPRGAAWAALLWAISPWSVSLGQEAWVYGSFATLSLWSVYLGDSAWRGSSLALAFFIPVSICGFLVQHVFIIPAAAAVALYFTLPRAERVGIARPVVSSVILLTAFVPMAVSFLGQFEARLRRMEASGHGGMDFHRLLIRPPAIFLRMWTGGMLPETLRELSASAVHIATAAAAAILQTAALAAVLLRKGPGRSFRIWIAAVLVLPFILFLSDDPTPRHFPLVWLALAAGMASLASWKRWLGAVSVGFCLVTLIRYYQVESWPYHMSDWEGAVRIVEERALEGDAVILQGAKTGMQAWNFYEVKDMERYSPHCMNPYLGADEAAEREDPALLLDRLIVEGRRVWLVDDYWQGPPLESLAGARPVLFDTTMGTIRIMLLDDADGRSVNVSDPPGGGPDNHPSGR